MALGRDCCADTAHEEVEEEERGRRQCSRGKSSAAGKAHDKSVCDEKTEFGDGSEGLSRSKAGIPDQSQEEDEKLETLRKHQDQAESSGTKPHGETHAQIGARKPHKEQIS